jgi:hypothetical protein
MKQASGYPKLAFGHILRRASFSILHSYVKYISGLCPEPHASPAGQRKRK